MVVLMVILGLHVLILFFSAKHDSINITLCISCPVRDYTYRKKFFQFIITIKKYHHEVHSLLFAW